MRTRTLLAMVGALLLGVAVAGPAWAKADIFEATINGPGLEGGMTIEGPDTDGLWESGIDVEGGLDDARADSIAALGLTRAELGPRYVAVYRFDHDPAKPNDLIRQDLYPYAYGGPVTYTQPGQELTGQLSMPIVAGWYRSPLGFFQYLVDHGLPETNPVTAVAGGEPDSDTVPVATTTPWTVIGLTLTGVTALLLMTATVRRRMMARTR